MRESAHFSEGAWLDFARGLLTGSRWADMRKHLDEPCETCGKVYRIWKTAVEAGAREAMYDAPGESLHLARAAYSAWRQRNILSQRAKPARLVFDSWLEPLPSGVRTEALSPRRLLHRAGAWLIDVELTPESGGRVSLAGQALPSRKEPGTVRDLKISVMSGDSLLAGTVANRFGEFQLEFQRAPDLRLYIEIPGKEPVYIPLPAESGLDEESL